MSRLMIDDNNRHGQVILSNQQLGRDIRLWKWVTLGVGAVVVASNIFLALSSTSQHKPLLLDTKTGQIITDYKHVLETYTIQERALLAKMAYEGLRRRTGIAAVDGQTLADWSGQITKKGIAAWSELGDRWTKPNLVEHGFRRSVRIISVMPDKTNAYAFTVEAIESDSMDGKPNSAKSYRVRVTLFFTDPKIDGQSKIESVSLHSEEVVE